MNQGGCDDGPCIDWKQNLNHRDVVVCEIVCSSTKPLGFNEIKRLTGLHQEVLSRILRRLQISGNIGKVSSKYDRCCSPGQ